MSFYGKEKIELEISQYTKIIKNNPSNNDLYFKRGMLNYKIGKYVEAINDFTKVIELNPHEPVVIYNRGKIYSNIKEYDKAIKDFTQAINLVPCNAACYYERGECYTKLHKYSYAVSDYTRAINLTPNNSVIFYKRANCYEILKNYNKALEDYTTVVNKNNCIKSNDNLKVDMSIIHSKLKEIKILVAKSDIKKVNTKPLYNNPSEDLYYKNKIKKIEETNMVNIGNFCTGTKVFHAVFGKGVIVSIDKDKIFVNFIHNGIVSLSKDTCLDGVILSIDNEESFETMLNKSDELYKNHNNTLEEIRVNLKIIKKLKTKSSKSNQVNILKYLIRLADAYNSSNMFLEAVETYKKILKIKPKDKDALDYIELHRNGEYHKQIPKATDFQHALWSGNVDIFEDDR